MAANSTTADEERRSCSRTRVLVEHDELRLLDIDYLGALELVVDIRGTRCHTNAMIDLDDKSLRALMSAIVEVEESKITYDEEGDLVVGEIGCGDAAAILAELRRTGWNVVHEAGDEDTA